jgi:hypothetical protein
MNNEDINCADMWDRSNDDLWDTAMSVIGLISVIICSTAIYD